MRIINGSNLCGNLDDASSVIKRMRHLPEGAQIVYDSETTGLDVRRDVVIGHVITLGPDPSDTYYVPVRHNGGNVAEGWDSTLDGRRRRETHPFEVEMNRVAQRRDLHWVGHNYDFDLRFLYSTGIDPLGTLECTQVNAALLNEFAQSFSLESSCWAVGAVAKKGEELYQHMANLFGGEPTRRAQMGQYWKLSGQDDIAADYAMGDGVSTWDLRGKQLAALQNQNMGYIHKLESRIVRVLYRMMKRGVRVNLDRAQEVMQTVNDRIALGLQKLPAQPDGSDFNVKAPSQIRKHLEANGITNWPMTKGKKPVPSFAEEWLKTFDIGRDIIAVRKYRHLANSFLTPMIEEHLYDSDRGPLVRTHYYQMAGDEFGTVTGRFSASKPNLQQAPKRNYEIGNLLRSIYVPNEGSRWLSADLSQCEPRILAHYSEAKVLVRGYMAKPFVDAHSSVTKDAGLEEMLGIPFEDAREYGKRLNQTLITGGGKQKIVAMLGANGERIYNAYFEAMPEIKVLQKQSANRMVARGYVISFLGRRARLESRDKSYKALNRLLQCGNADIVKQAMADMDEYFEAEGDIVGIINTVHDSVDLDVPLGFEEMAEAGLRFMCQFGPGRRFELGVPMAADYAYGNTWAEASYPKKGEKRVLGAEADDPRFLVSV